MEGGEARSGRRRTRWTPARRGNGGGAHPLSPGTSGASGEAAVRRGRPRPRRSGLSSGELSRAEEEERELGVRCCGGVEFLGASGAIL
jgi:hypothetical protein